MIGFDYLPIEVSAFMLLLMNPCTILGKGCKEFITYSEIIIIINLFIKDKLTLCLKASGPNASPK